ncbi:MAG: tetratricopeptide repeat protein [Bacteroidetes bacterium]|nr:MAG: tetratricopeptide repeat protein [Bacteroidota bacterium]
MRELFVLLCALSCLLTACQTPQKPGTESSAIPDSLDQSPAAQIRSLNRQLEINPRDYTLYQQRSEQYYNSDSIEKALADAEMALSLFPNSPDLKYWKGFLAFTQNDSAEAMIQYREAIRLGTKDPEVYYQMGQIFFLQKKYEAALASYQKAVELNDHEPLYWFAQGFLEEQRLQKPAAIKRYMRALELDSLHTKTLLQLYDLYLTGYENEEMATRYLDRLLRNQPLHPLGRYYSGTAHLRKALGLSRDTPRYREEVNEAVSDFTISVSRDPGFADAWYSRGYCYFMGENRLDEAIGDFRKVLEINPQYAQAHFMLGSIFEYNKDLQTALFHYRKAVEYKPESEDFALAVKELEAQLK